MDREQTNGTTVAKVAAGHPSTRIMAKMIQVSSVRPSVVEKGFLPIVANTRATKGKTIEPANKLRAIIVAEWNVSDLPSKWAGFCLNQLQRVAVSQLAAQWEKEGNEWKETDAELYTVDGLLMYAAREAESKRLNADNIKTLTADFVLTLAEARRADAVKILCSMSAPSKSGTEKECAALADKLATWMDAQEECDNIVLPVVQRKLAERAAELKAQREAYETDNAAF